MEKRTQRERKGLQGEYTKCGSVCAAIWAAVAALGAQLIALGRSFLRGFSPPSGQLSACIGGFVVNTVECEVPTLDEAMRRLKVEDLVQQELALTWTELEALPAADVTYDFVCVEGCSVGEVRCRGLRTAEIMQRATPRLEAAHVVFHASAGVCADSHTIRQARDECAILAYRLRGEPLNPRQGCPPRLIAPWMYGSKGLERVERIEFIGRGFRGDWDQLGYPVYAAEILS